MAAISVVLLHVSRNLISDDLDTTGFLAVDFFFLMSGFVIGHAYEERLLNGWPTGQFIRARLVRLYPLAIVGFALGVAAWAVEAVAHVNRYSFPTTMVFFAFGSMFIPRLFGAGGGYLFPLNTALWSLFFELWANAGYAAVKRFPNPVLVLLMIIGGLGCTLIWARGGSLDVGALPHNFAGGICRIGFSFPLGLLLYRGQQAGWLANLGGVTPKIPIAMLAVLLLMPISPGVSIAPFEMMCLFLLFPAILCMAVEARISDKRGRWLGQLSYPLYATHIPVITAAKAIIVGCGIGGAGSMAVAAAAIVTALIVGDAAGRWYDPAARRLMAHLLFSAPAEAKAKDGGPLNYRAARLD